MQNVNDMNCKGVALLLLMFVGKICFGQLTKFELSNGMETATYAETIAFYKKIATSSKRTLVEEKGMTDAGLPLHLVSVSADNKFSPTDWHKQGKVVIMINNGIHPGEPDGIDASMMLVRDIAIGKIILPPNVVLSIIPIYNIGGALNRNSSTRVNQNGPIEYGFRGNAQNLDLNRDFTKNDSKNAKSFAEIFHYLKPDVFIDNHVSDGADYQHTMTLITTQFDKLGGVAGNFLRDVFEPRIYASMKAKNWDLIPYVEFDGTDFSKGIVQFNETPRYSSGYATLFNTFSFIPETHMLKPYKERVQSTYDLLVSFIKESSLLAKEIKTTRAKANQETILKNNFFLKWQPDFSKNTNVSFSGYEQDSTESAATGLKKMFYNRNLPYSRTLKYFSFFKGVNEVTKPAAYIIPAGWYSVMERLELNGVKIQRLKKDTTIGVTVQRIEDYKTRLAYEKHYPHYNITTSRHVDTLSFLKGDYLIKTGQVADRYVVEMLEPTGDDSFFAWNFFDAILQQKEGYSDYRWEDIAAEILREDVSLKTELEKKKIAEPNFAKDSRAILSFIYKNSKWHEAAHLRYPVYRIEKAQSN